MQITRTSDQSTSALETETLLHGDFEITPVVFEAGEVEEALVDEIGCFDLLVLDNDRIVILGQRQRIDAALMLGARWDRELGSHQAAGKDCMKVRLNQRMKHPLRREVGLLDWREFLVTNRKKRHYFKSLRRLATGALIITPPLNLLVKVPAPHVGQ